MLIDGTNASTAKYNVIVNGRVVRHKVPKMVAENYIINLDENSQKEAKMVPVTDEGKEILLG
jgi:hypothetical protein